jgi:hypothetical protein
MAGKQLSQDEIEQFVQIFQKRLDQDRVTQARGPSNKRTSLSLPTTVGFQTCWQHLTEFRGMPQDVLDYCTQEHFIDEISEDSGRKIAEHVRSETEWHKQSYVVHEWTRDLLKSKALELNMTRNELVATLVVLAGRPSADELRDRTERQREAVELLRKSMPFFDHFKNTINAVFEGQEMPLQMAILGPIEQLEDIDDYVRHEIEKRVEINQIYFEKMEYLLSESE